MNTKKLSRVPLLLLSLICLLSAVALTPAHAAQNLQVGSFNGFITVYTTNGTVVNTYTTPNRTLGVIQDYTGNAYFNNYGNTIYKLNTKTGAYATYATVPTINSGSSLF